MNRMTKLLSMIALIPMILTLTACGAYGSSPSPVQSPAAGSAKGQVTIAGFAFSPQNLDASVGDKVTWTNKDTTTHTVTSDDKVFDSGKLAPGKDFSFTFDKAGVYPYHCNIHSSMKGTITVK